MKNGKQDVTKSRSIWFRRVVLAVGKHWKEWENSDMLIETLPQVLKGPESTSDDDASSTNDYEY
jgi:hypothetical protein